MYKTIRIFFVQADQAIKFKWINQKKVKEDLSLP